MSVRKRMQPSTAKQTTEVKALAMASKLHLKPLGPYPGAHQPWELECLRCGTVSTKKAHTVTSGKGCLKCNSGNSARLRKANAANPAIAAMATGRPQSTHPLSRNSQAPGLASV